MIDQVVQDAPHAAQALKQGEDQADGCLYLLVGSNAAEPSDRR
jgi:hypothetical protein